MMSLSPELTKHVNGPRTVAKKLAYAIDDVAKSTAGSVVLAYHRVGGQTASPVDLDRSMFRRQMAHVRAACTVDSADTYVAHHELGRGTAVGPQQRVLLTFDDGTADFLDEVVPVLVEYDLPATVYVATAHIDEQLDFPAEGKPISWAGLRDAVSTGLVTVGAHTHTHRLLDRCSVAEVVDELDRSNARIAEEVGIVPQHFAYPKAVRAGGLAEREVKRRYRSAAIAGTRPNAPGQTDLYRLHRSPIQVADGWEGFQRKLVGGMRVEDDVRRLLNRYRYRGLSQ